MKSRKIFYAALCMTVLLSLPVFSQSVLNDDFYNNNAQLNFNQSVNTKARVIQTSTQPPSWFYLGQSSSGSAGSISELYFSIPEKLQVRITIIDMMGQEINEIINSNLSEGTYKISFDVSGLSSGVYTYRLQTEDYSEMKKMLLIK
ncbi:MAG: T9SS type A sorting domain-containing protein [Ignavibacteria bacterium]